MGNLHTQTSPIHEYGKEVEGKGRKRTCKRGEKGWGGQWKWIRTRDNIYV